MAENCTKLEVDADGNMKFVETNYWEFTGTVRCSHCGKVFHDGTKRFAAASAAMAWELLKAKFGHM